MNDNLEFEKNVKVLIDDLKSVCANYGLGNDGNEFKIITQLFLYKFLNDRFIKEVKLIDKNLSDSKDIFDKLDNYNKKDFEMLLMQMDENTARLYPNQLISHIYTKQNEDNFSSISASVEKITTWCEALGKNVSTNLPRCSTSSLARGVSIINGSGLPDVFASAHKTAVANICFSRIH